MGLANINGGTRFGMTMSVACRKGHSVTQTCEPADANYEFTCKANGKFGAHPDCERVKCPVPSDILHSSHDATGKVYFSDRVTYTADKGYSRNGFANGHRSITIRCSQSCTYDRKA